MRPSEAGQNWEGYGRLIFIGLIVGVLYMWVFDHAVWEAIYILPLAILATGLIFAFFVIIINYLKES